MNCFVECLGRYHLLCEREKIREISKIDKKRDKGKRALTFVELPDVVWTDFDDINMVSGTGNCHIMGLAESLFQR